MDYEMGIMLYLHYNLSLAWTEFLNGHETENVLPNLPAVFL